MNSAPATLTARNEVSIRPAYEADARALAPLLTELGYPTAEPAVRDRLAVLSTTGEQALVAVAQGHVVALVLLHRTWFLHRPPDGRIVTLVVAASHRGRGIGAQLLAAAEEVFRQWGCGRAEVSSGATREAAHRFYCRVGYEEQPKRFVKPLLT
ncbi:GNAT family N-acetyltransferase [Hymenobacter sp. BT664]|uniref:GNAT family N-acetyltransferase n=1 Tax=Hymenobacter montanus TaxID=2771359 RepID=A0A927GLP9_9BACT|nr:GNAT family N-acetyltransferase [Hymenobacter montanus]MBD2770411.1 GNAT family N-acetyltransferase [Hymenobacter montanus]